MDTVLHKNSSMFIYNTCSMQNIAVQFRRNQVVFCFYGTQHVLAWAPIFGVQYIHGDTV
jgi:hypothetical protein